jgi:hypothetical protein
MSFLRLPAVGREAGIQYLKKNNYHKESLNWGINKTGVITLTGRLKTNIGGEKFIVQKEKIQNTQLNLKNLHSDSTST